MATVAISLPDRISSALGWRDQHPPDTLPTGIQSMDALVGGAPRGRITEIAGPASSGRTTILHSLLAEAGQRGEYCAIVDTTDSFDPRTASEAGARLDTLVWVRCGGNVEHAIRSADLLLHSGGFGVVALDLCDLAPQAARRIPLSYWYRFRRAVETTQTVMLVLSRDPQAKSCASVLAEVEREETDLAAGPAAQSPFRLLRGARFRVVARRPQRPHAAYFEANSAHA